MLSHSHGLIRSPRSSVATFVVVVSFVSLFVRLFPFLVLDKKRIQLRIAHDICVSCVFPYLSDPW